MIMSTPFHIKTPPPASGRGSGRVFFSSLPRVRRPGIQHLLRGMVAGRADVHGVPALGDDRAFEVVAQHVAGEFRHDRAAARLFQWSGELDDAAGDGDILDRLGHAAGGDDA